jgi:chemotaxis response regulator CheB
MDPASIRILIVDDHPVVRAGLASMLRTHPGIEVIGSASSGGEALALLDPAVRPKLDVRPGRHNSTRLTPGARSLRQRALGFPKHQPGGSS